ncbi:UNVERIFIED_CONTAM: hypothetical protein FKN15_059900 [Acipenser sinensis]
MEEEVSKPEKHVSLGAHHFSIRDPMAVERANLLNMAKLSIKGLIESALSFGRTLDSDYPPLQQFFVVMEHCLKHGLKVKKSFLGYNKSLWGPLELVEKLCPEAGEIAASVRDLPGLKTPLGRARAWLRLALMQKKLADYLCCLITRKDLLSDFYEYYAVMVEEEGAVIVGLLVGLNVIDANLCVKGEDLDSQVRLVLDSVINFMDDFYEYYAVMVEEEGAVIVGLLVGLNVIDANLCVKGEDLDSQVGVIDFSIYLKNDVDDYRSEESCDSIYVGVIDFSIYLKNDVDDYRSEESSTVHSLQGRVDSMERSNTKLIEELAIAKNNIIKLQEENHQLRNENTIILMKAHQQLEVTKVDVDSELDTYKQSRERMDEMYNNENTIILMKAHQQLEVTKVDVDSELDTYKQSRERMDEMYNETRRQLREECQLRQVNILPWLMQMRLSCFFGGMPALKLCLSLQEVENELVVQVNILPWLMQMRLSCFFGGMPALKLCLSLQEVENELVVQEVENELVVQVSMKHEMELAMKLLEKDIHEKQDTLIGLRHQLDEVKAINIEMYQRMQHSDDDLKQKNDIISRLEEKTNQITATMKQLEQRTRLETDLKIEKEWRQTLQNDLQRERGTISQLTTEARQINGLKKEFYRLQDENCQLKRICEEQEQALQELGYKLSESKIKIEDIKEANKALQGGQVWLKDKDATRCKLCEKEFSISRRKHHCRNCGEIFCNSCSDNELPLPASPKPVRVCDTCHAMLLQCCSSNSA